MSENGGFAVRRRSLSTAVLLLALTLPRCGDRAAAQSRVASAPVTTPGRVVIATSGPVPAAAAPVAPSAGSAPSAEPAPVQRPRFVIASSVPQNAPPVVPIPDDGLKLLPLPTGTLPAVPPGLQLATFHVPPAPPAAPGVGSGVPPSALPRGKGQTVSLYLEKIGPSAGSVGRPFSYELVVANAGPTPVEGVRVVDELPDHAQCLRTEPAAEAHGRRLEWDLGRLEAGAERRLRVEVRPGRAGKFQDLASAACSIGPAAGADVRPPQLALTLNGPAQAPLGAAVAFHLQVTNNGTGPATHVVVHDRLPRGLKHAQGSDVRAELGTLAPGESKALTLETTAVAGGRQVNEAVATADDGLEAPASAPVQVGTPVLAVRLTGPKETALAGELEQRLEVVNTGTAPATGVRLANVLPEGLEFLAAGDGGAYTAGTRQVDWAIGTLAPGPGRAVTVRVVARKPGDWLNQAVAQADWGLEARAGAPVHVEGVPALALQVKDQDNPIEIGAETTYDLRVLNQGTAACSQLQLEAVVPDGLTLVGAEPPAHRVMGQRVLFDPVAALAAHADSAFRVKVRAKAAGDWRFKAYLSCEQLQRPVCQEKSTQVYDGGDDGPAPAPPAAPGGKAEEIPRR
jgi:uncharacterized repeat protein (TIGR01451 family)